MRSNAGNSMAVVITIYFINTCSHRSTIRIKEITT